MSHVKPRCGICSHRAYLMSCEDFDAFTEECGDRCAICGRAGHETGHGFLNIDHDPFVGQWAVRGRLCTSCNTRISVNRATTPKEVAYLADPWYRRRFAALGINCTPEAEPALGAVIAIQKERRLLWCRSKDGWRRVSGYSGIHTWDMLNHHYGPHRIRIVSGQAALS